MAGWHRAGMALTGLLGLSGCATGADTTLTALPGGADAGQTSGAVVGEAFLAENAPHLLAASGTALLPGSRRSPAVGLADSRVDTPLAVATLASPNVPGTAAPVAGTGRAQLPLVGNLLGAANRAATAAAGGVPAGARQPAVPPGQVAVAVAAPAPASATVAVSPAAASIRAAVGVSPGAQASVRAAPPTPTAAPVTASIAVGPVAQAAVRAAVMPTPALQAATAAPGLNASVSVSGPRPLSGITAPTIRLLAPQAAATLGAAPAPTAVLAVGGGSAPQSAATRLVATASGVVNRAASSGLPPVTAPTVSRVPTATQLGAVASRLPRPPGL